MTKGAILATTIRSRRAAGADPRRVAPGAGRNGGYQFTAPVSPEAAKQIAYRGPGYLEFTCRPHAIGRAVRNILENAVEYGGAKVATILERPDRVEIHVADDGPGIPTEEQQRVFEPFYRLDRARSTDHQGSGLGSRLPATSCAPMAATSRWSTAPQVDCW